jgi:hypothetical protein
MGRGGGAREGVGSICACASRLFEFTSSLRKNYEAVTLESFHIQLFWAVAIIIMLVIRSSLKD